MHKRSKPCGILLAALLATITAGVKTGRAITVMPGQTVAVPLASLAELTSQDPYLQQTYLSPGSGASQTATLQQSVYTHDPSADSVAFVYQLSATAQGANNPNLSGAVTVGGFASTFTLPPINNSTNTEVKIWQTNVFALSGASGQALVSPVSVTRSNDGSTLTFNYAQANTNQPEPLADLVVQTDAPSYAPLSNMRGVPFSVSGLFSSSTALSFNPVVGPYAAGSVPPSSVPEPRTWLLLPMGLCALALRQRARRTARD